MATIGAETKINPKAFGLAIAVTVSLFWSLRSAGAFLLMALEVYISGFYGYTDLSGYDWKPEIARFAACLLVFGFGAYFAGWTVAAVYNFLSGFGKLKLR